MQELVKQFSINDVQMYREQNEDMDFSVVEIWALAEGSNSHRNPFSREVLERDAETFKGKLIVARFNDYENDVEAHELDEQIVGYVDPTVDVQFKSKVVDGQEKEFAVVKGLISKVYAKNVVDMFRDHNERTVSCEFSCATEYEEDEHGFVRDHLGNIVENPILAYHIHGITILGLKYNPSVRGTEIKVKQFVEQYDEIKNYADSKVIAETFSKVFERIAKLEQNQTSKDDDDKTTTELKQEVTMEDEKKLSEPTDNNETDENLVMSDNANVEPDEKCAEEKKCAENEDGETDANKKDDSETDKKEEEGKEMSVPEATVEAECGKKFSLTDYVTVDFNEENEEVKAFVEKVFAMEANELMTEFVALVKENIELKQFRNQTIEAERDTQVNTLMASVKEDLDAKQFSELLEEGLATNLDSLGAFANKVKAFAYEATKGKEKVNKQVVDEEHLSYAGVVENKSSHTIDDVYQKYV